MAKTSEEKRAELRARREAREANAAAEAAKPITAGDSVRSPAVKVWQLALLTVALLCWIVAMHVSKLRRALECQRVDGVAVQGETWTEIVCIDKTAVRRLP